MSILMQLYRKFVPHAWRIKIHHQKQVYITKKFRSRFFNYYHSKRNNSLEEQEVIDFLKKNFFIPVFPYKFPLKYRKEEIVVYDDPISGLKYVYYENRKLYFKRSWNADIIRKNFNYLLIEQDSCSPHKYLTSEFNVEMGDVVVDIGSAEGIFSLAVIESVSRLYLLEYDDEWIEALHQTFQPWSDKAEIIKKYVSKQDLEDQVSVDYLFKDKHIDFLKIDVDGAEQDLIDGASVTFYKKQVCKIAICTYHYQDDYDKFYAYFRNLNPLMIEHSPGFMFYRDDTDEKPPFIRRGLLRVKF